MKRRTSWLRQAALVVAGGALVLGVAIGFWPVSASVAGGASYSCGSGFVHSRQAWKVDAGSLAQSPEAVGASTATPNARVSLAGVPESGLRLRAPRPRGRHLSGPHRLVGLRPGRDTDDGAPPKAPPGHCVAATPTTGTAGGSDPSEPTNGRFEKSKMPPSDPTIR